MTVKRLNQWLGDKLAIWLSTMGCFYLIFALVVVPLFFQHPQDLVGWVQYIVQSIFQGVALPVLGYVARISGEKQERVMNETHDVVMDELAIVKKELALANEERDSLKKLIKELHQITQKKTKESL
jgi:cell shape-determining protein MreC